MADHATLLVVLMQHWKQILRFWIQSDKIQITPTLKEIRRYLWFDTLRHDVVQARMVVFGQLSFKLDYQRERMKLKSADCINQSQCPQKLLNS